MTRLLEGGLAVNRAFAGHIKVYSCESAESDRAPQVGRPVGNVSTAFVNRFGKPTGSDLQLRATPPARGGGALTYSRLASESATRMN